MSKSKQHVEKHRITRVDTDTSMVYYRRNGTERSILWDPRFGTFPDKGDTRKMTFGGKGKTAKLILIEKYGHEQPRGQSWRDRFCPPPIWEDVDDLQELEEEYA
jgi:hypothetical protein